MTSTTTDNSRSTGFRYNPEAARSAQHNARASAAKSAYAAAVKNLAPEYIRDESAFHVQPDVREQEHKRDVERQVAERLQAGTFTWEWAEEVGIHLPTKDDNWDDLLAANPHPDTNKPKFHAEQLMSYVMSDLSKKNCSPVAMLVAAYYASFFNPYRGGLHPEFFRVQIALNITQREYDEAMREIKDADTVLIPVKSTFVVSSGWWLKVSADANERLSAWLSTPAAGHLRRTFDPSRRTLIKYNLRYSAISDHAAQLASTILASRIPMKVQGWEPEGHEMLFGDLEYRSSWLASHMNVTTDDAERAIQLLSESGLWDINQLGPGRYLFRVSQQGHAAYKEYYPFVFHTRMSAKLKGLDETKHYERRMRGRMRKTFAWRGTSSEWAPKGQREDWLLHPHEFPEASGKRGWSREDRWMIVYVIRDPITGEVIYVGITSRTMLERLLEHITRAGVTYSERNGKKCTEHNVLMAARMRTYQEVGVEPLIEKAAVVRGEQEARRVEKELIQQYEMEYGKELLNSIHSSRRPDIESRKAKRKAAKAAAA